MIKRLLGKTGLEVSILGFGGFHLVETLQSDADILLNHYLDSGGNYIETAASYGGGISEKKIGKAIANRRNDYILATKSGERKKEGFIKEVNRSLTNLRTDHVDIVFLHGVATDDALSQIFSEDGAYSGYLELKKDGKVKYLGISMHGQPDTLIRASREFPVDIIMSTINYYDAYNYPDIENVLMPLAKEKDLGIVLMKPIGDGYLYRSPQNAFKYAFSRDVGVVVTGANNMEMLRMDIDIANTFDLSQREIDKLEQDIAVNSVELGKYVCRRCGKCDICPEKIDIMEIFKLEGWFDRQMYNGIIENAPAFALKERLRFWFGNYQRAVSEYKKLDRKFADCTNCGKCSDICPYGIDIMAKLKICENKLTGSEEN